jgi:hypothetical protein
MSSDVVVDFSNDRLDDMRSYYESRKEEIKDGLINYVNTVIAPDADDKNWSWIASANMSTIIQSWKFHMDRCQQTLDKTIDKMKDLSREDNGTEISINNMDKIIFAKNAQVLNVERATFAFDTLVGHYPKVFGKEYTPYVKGKLAKVETDAKSQKWAKEQIRLAL